MKDTSTESLFQNQGDDNGNAAEKPPGVLDQAVVKNATPRFAAEAQSGNAPTSNGGADFDPFDPESLRLSQDFSATVGVKKKLMTVPVRKPSKEWYVQTHPNERYGLETAVVELKEDREIYLVEKKLWPELSTESTFSARMLFTSITRQGVLFLWPVRLPGTDGRLDEWSKSALEAAELASGRWVRVQANMHLQAYDVFEAMAELPAPEWPDIPLSELLRIAFKDRFIDSVDHPVLRQLRGEV